MRIINYIVLVLIALALSIVGFANRGPVTLSLFPADLVPFTGFNYEITLPIYIVAFGGIAIGLLLGFVFEWIREGRYRSEAVNNRREKVMLAREVEKLKAETKRYEGKDEILALIDQPKKAS